MTRMLLGAVALVFIAATASAQLLYQEQGTYSTYGNQTYGPGGTQSQYRNQLYTPQGTYSTYGNQTYGPNGNTFSTYGNHDLRAGRLHDNHLWESDLYKHAWRPNCNLLALRQSNVL